MTVDEARDYLTRCRDRNEPEPATVLYRPMHGTVRCEGERGAITRVSGTWAFVDFGRGGSQATDPADLELLAGS